VFACLRAEFSPCVADVKVDRDRRNAERRGNALGAFAERQGAEALAFAHSERLRRVPGAPEGGEFMFNSRDCTHFRLIDDID